jgi:hypothetical protein
MGGWPKFIWASRVGVSHNGSRAWGYPHPGLRFRRCYASSPLGRPSPQGGGIQLPSRLKSQTLREARFNLLICDYPATRGRDSTSSRFQSRRSQDARFNSISYAVARHPAGPAVARRDGKGYALVKIAIAVRNCSCPTACGQVEFLASVLPRPSCQLTKHRTEIDGKLALVHAYSVFRPYGITW